MAFSEKQLPLQPIKNSYNLLIGDVRNLIKNVEDNSIDCCVTSPPYWNLRDYGCKDQIGLEATLEDYISNIVNVFEEVRRVIKPRGTLWLNLGDSYAANRSYQVSPTKWKCLPQGQGAKIPTNLKAKDLIGIPWRIAFALQAKGWYLRQDLIWYKPNCMPESVRDRCTKSHEYLFFFSKSKNYFYDQRAIKESAVSKPKIKSEKELIKISRTRKALPNETYSRHRSNIIGGQDLRSVVDGTRNRRSVWIVPTTPFKGAHFAVMPIGLVEPCILAGCPSGGTILDPFLGSGTVGVASLKNNRNFIGFDINPKYIAMAEKRIQDLINLQ